MQRGRLLTIQTSRARTTRTAWEVISATGAIETAQSVDNGRRCQSYRPIWPDHRSHLFRGGIAHRLQTARSVLAVSSGRARTSSGTTAVAASATPRGSSGLRRTLDVGNAAPARPLASGEMGPHTTLALGTDSPLALRDAPRGSMFTCFPLRANIRAQTLRRNPVGTQNFRPIPADYHI